MVMKRKRRMRAAVRSIHPLIGVWREEENPVSTSSVVFTIGVVEGRFVVTAIDEQDGESLRISNLRWDGKALRFTAVCPSTTYIAEHALRLLGNGRISMETTGTTKEILANRATVRKHFTIRNRKHSEVLFDEEVRWDGKVVHHDLSFPGYEAKHVFRPLEDGRLSHEVTSTDYEVWRRQPRKIIPAQRAKRR